MDEISGQATLFNKARDKIIINTPRVGSPTLMKPRTINCFEKCKYFISKSSSDIDQLRRSSIISSMSAQSAQSCDAFTEKENRKRKLEGSTIFIAGQTTLNEMFQLGQRKKEGNLLVMPKKPKRFVYYELKFWRKRKNSKRKPRMRVPQVPMTHQIHPTNKEFTLPATAFNRNRIAS